MVYSSARIKKRDDATVYICRRNRYGDCDRILPEKPAAMVLTGANASGKSTFMKAVAINVILAQTINTCVAKNMKMPAIQVMTSMALRDDVLQERVITCVKLNI